MDTFWRTIDRQLEELREARTVDDVLATCPKVPGLCASDGFFEGGGGDGTVYDSLVHAGWHTVWREAHYYWCAASPDRSEFLTYVEGDLYRGDTRAGTR